MVVTAEAERCKSWLTCTCVTTTNCSVPPASNYTVATYKHRRASPSLKTFHTARLVLWASQKVSIGIQILNDCP